MGLVSRYFLIDDQDRIYRLSSHRFWQMRNRPQDHALYRFAGKRVRMADIVVELQARRPVRIVRSVFAMITFNSAGFLDVAAIIKGESARSEAALAPKVLEVSATYRSGHAVGSLKATDTDHSIRSLGTFQLCSALVPDPRLPHPEAHLYGGIRPMTCRPSGQLTFSTAVSPSKSNRIVGPGQPLGFARRSRTEADFRRKPLLIIFHGVNSNTWALLRRLSCPD